MVGLRGKATEALDSLSNATMAACAMPRQGHYKRQFTLDGNIKAVDYCAWSRMSAVRHAMLLTWTNSGRLQLVCSGVEFDIHPACEANCEAPR